MGKSTLSSQDGKRKSSSCSCGPGGNTEESARKRRKASKVSSGDEDILEEIIVVANTQYEKKGKAKKSSKPRKSPPTARLPKPRIKAPGRVEAGPAVAPPLPPSPAMKIGVVKQDNNRLRPEGPNGIGKGHKRNESACSDDFDPPFPKPDRRNDKKKLPPKSWL